MNKLFRSASAGSAFHGVSPCAIAAALLRSRFLFIIGLFVFTAGTSFGQRPGGRGLTQPVNKLAPFVTSPQSVVERMLEAAQIKANELVYDLGSGDGRVLITAAQKYGARGVGIEISEPLVKATGERLQRLNLANRVKIIHEDLMNVDLSPADVVIIYLESKSNELLRPNMEKYLRPGARVVSHDFEVKGWKPGRVDRIEAFNREHSIYVYEMPQKAK